MTDIEQLLQLPNVEKVLAHTGFRLKARAIAFDTYSKTITIKIDDLLALEFFQLKDKNEQD